jgi:hypothetical protein
VSKPRTGSAYTYGGEQGLGATHSSRDLSSEMHDLDLHPGTAVKVHGYDDDRDLVLIEWTDLAGNPRITSVEPERFAHDFTKGA